MFYYYRQAWSRSFDFDGRSSRSEFWYFQLGKIVFELFFGLIAIMSALFCLPIITVLAVGLIIVHCMLNIIPSISVSVRRMHDINKSGWTLLLYLVPVIGPVVILIFLCTAGDYHSNQYGLNPISDEQEHIYPFLV